MSPRSNRQPRPADDTASVAVAAAREIIAAQRAEIEAQQELAASLTSRIAELERRLGLDSSSRGKPPSSNRLGRGRGPAGDHALTNAEREARRRRCPPLIHAVASTGAAVPSAGEMPLPCCWRSRANTQRCSRHCRQSPMTAPRPRPSKPSSHSTSIPWADTEPPPGYRPDGKGRHECPEPSRLPHPQSEKPLRSCCARDSCAGRPGCAGPPGDAGWRPAHRPPPVRPGP